jgi:rhamnulokinase
VSARLVNSKAVVAVDLGASSGRVILGHAAQDRLELHEVHRFANQPVRLPDGLHWNVAGLYMDVLDGLRAANRRAPAIVSIGIDSWAVDYGLVDYEGRLLGLPYHYRDRRTERGVERVEAALSREALYERTGLQFLPVNTIYQLAAALGTPELEAANRMLLIPDLIGYWLTGRQAAERTNASTTGLFDLDRGGWAFDLAELVGLRASLLPPVVDPGDVLGPLAVAADEPDLPAGAVVTLVGSHDTASAVVGIPLEDEGSAFISCGTWALVGFELQNPIRSDASREANFTNEAGVDGHVRFLRNVTGLWLLDECVRAWGSGGPEVSLDELLAGAAAESMGGPTFDPNDPAFVAPGDMPSRIIDACRTAGQPLPQTPSAVVRAILDSLANAFQRTLADAERLTGRAARRIHLVGGGSQNALLCQLTADACELTVVAGPAEATAIGNVLVQARAHGIVDGDLAAMRHLVRRTQRLREYHPRSVQAGVGR